VKTLLMNKEPEEALKLAKELKEFLPEREEAASLIAEAEEELSKPKNKKK